MKKIEIRYFDGDFTNIETREDLIQALGKVLFILIDGHEKGLDQNVIESIYLENFDVITKNDIS